MVKGRGVSPAKKNSKKGKSGGVFERKTGRTQSVWGLPLEKMG